MTDDRHLRGMALHNPSRTIPPRILGGKEVLEIIGIQRDERHPDLASLIKSLQDHADRAYAELNDLRSRKYPSDLVVDTARKAASSANNVLYERQRALRDAKAAFDAHHASFWTTARRRFGLRDAKAAEISSTLEIATGAKEDAERAFNDADDAFYAALGHRAEVRKTEAGAALSRIDDLDDARNALLRARDNASGLSAKPFTLAAAVDLGRSIGLAPPLKEAARRRSRSQRLSSTSSGDLSSSNSLATSVAIGMAFGTSFLSD